MKAVIIGSKGQLGSDLMREYGDSAIGLAHEDIEVTDPESVREALPNGVDVVINTAAFHNTDQCEDMPDKTFRVNSVGKEVADYRILRKPVHVDIQTIVDLGDRLAQIPELLSVALRQLFE